MTLRVPILCAALAALACDPAPGAPALRSGAAPAPSPDPPGCNACHSTWTPNCMTCHMDFDFAQTVGELGEPHAPLGEWPVDPDAWGDWLADADAPPVVGCPALSP